MGRAGVFILSAALMAAFAAPAADLVFEGGGERMAVPGERLDLIVVARDTQGAPAVQFRMSDADAKAFHQLTRKTLGRELSVVVCDEVLLRPIVREPIANGGGIIAVGTTTEAMTLRDRLSGEEACPGGGGS